MVSELNIMPIFDNKWMNGTMSLTPQEIANIDKELLGHIIITQHSVAYLKNGSTFADYIYDGHNEANINNIIGKKENNKNTDLNK